DVVHDGNVWSFYGRIRDAVSRWNTEISPRYAQGGAHYDGAVRRGDKNLILDEVAPSDGSTAVTRLTLDIPSGGCFLQRHNSDDAILFGEIHYNRARTGLPRTTRSGPIGKGAQVGGT